jgi:tetratricopeptide (TPR) repeat protein
MLSDYRRMAYKLKLLDKHSDVNDPIYIDKIHEFLADKEDWLLIFDNVTHLGTMQKWAPTSGAGSILYTTRSPDVAESLVDERSDAFEVEPLQLKHAVELTMSLRKERHPHEEIIKVAEKLCISLGCLPIAINSAVDVANTNSMSLITLMQRLEKKEAVLDEQAGNSSHECNKSVWALFLLALETVETKSKQAAALMKVLIYLDTTSIPLELVKEGASKLEEHFQREIIYPRGAIYHNRWRPPQRRAKPPNDDKNESLDTLSWWRKSIQVFSKPNPEPEETSSRPDSTSDEILHKFYQGNKALRDLFADTDRIDNAILPLKHNGLLRKNNDNTIWIHDLIRDVILESLSGASNNSRGSEAGAHLAMTLVYLTFPEPPEPLHYAAIYDKSLQYQPHALCTLERCKDFYFDTTIGPELMHMLASFFHFRTERELKTLMRDVTRWFQRAFDGYFNVWKRQRQRRWEEMGRPEMWRVDATIALDERDAYEHEDRYGRGLAFSRTCNTYERFGGPARRLFDTALKLAVVLRRDDPFKASEWATKAVKGYESILGPNHDLTFDALGLELELHKATKQFEEGQLLALKRADVYERRSGLLTLTEPGAQCGADMGFFCEKLGQIDDAICWYGFALSGRQAARGMDDPSLSGTVLTIACLHERQHRHQKAAEMCNRALVLCETGDSELGASQARNELATSLLRLGQGNEAVRELTKVWGYLHRIHESFADTDEITRPIWLKCCWNFGLAHLILGKDMKFPPGFEECQLDESERRMGKIKTGPCDCVSGEIS